MQGRSACRALVIQHKRARDSGNAPGRGVSRVGGKEVASGAAVPRCRCRPPGGRESYGSDGSVRASEGACDDRAGDEVPWAECRMPMPNAECRGAEVRVPRAERRKPRCRIPHGRVARNRELLVTKRWCWALPRGREREATRPVVREERKPRGRPGGGCRRSCVVGLGSW